MNNQRWQEAKKLFHAVIDCEPSERAAFLDANCKDESLRREVEELIAANEEAGDFIVAPALVDAGLVTSQTDGNALEDEIALNIGKRVGRYELAQEIGRGGMGAVYLAVRADDEFKQQVAIKIIKRGMDTDFIVRRFRHERQILASLNHTNIARLLDGGTTEDGLPYFVMEYVEGEPINKYCATRDLNTKERLKLFRKVCSAVSYAHQHLIVHRDIKPNNIIVTKDGEPKLLDFGIAKLLNPEHNEDAETTTEAFRLMTPEYASPEQLRGQPITTTSDVYSLGVVLYELLSGHRPYKKLESRLPEEIIQAILTEEPIRPSEAVSVYVTGKRGDAATITTKDQTTNQQSAIGNRQLKGDLDNIVLKALRKEQTRRYSSVQEFSEDIRRHLEGLPVTARQDTFTYRASKFIQRHKAVAVAATVVIFTLLSATAITTWQARVAKRERDKAERRFNDVRKLASSFMFEFHDSIQDLPGSTSARELVVKKALEYLDNLAREENADPALKLELATAYKKVGDIQGYPYGANLGDTRGALESYHKALEIEEALVKFDPKNRSYQENLATTYLRLSSLYGVAKDKASSLESCRKSLTIMEELAALYPEDESIRRRLPRHYETIGDVLSDIGQLDEALRMYYKGSEIIESLLRKNPNDEDALHLLIVNYDSISATLGNSKYTNLGEPERALEVIRKGVDLCAEKVKAETTGGEYYRTWLAQNLKSAAELQGALGDWNGSVQSNRKSLEVWEPLVKADPKDVFRLLFMAYTQTNLAEGLAETGNTTEALAILRRAIEIVTKICESDPDKSVNRAYLAYSYTMNAKALVKAKDPVAALESYRKAVELYGQLVKDDGANLQNRLELALPCLGLGKIYVALAENAKGEKQVEFCKKAQTYLRCSADSYRELEKHFKLTKKQQGEFEEAKQGIAQCDAALAKLETK
jgi:serine/threonine protein kinase